jgi:dolichyl-phosphate-mannose--protein O-mannosyl transferase
MIGCGLAAIGMFLHFADFTFGFDTAASDYLNKQFFKSWDFVGK